MKCQGEHGFCTRQEWADFFEEYTEIVAGVSQDSILVPKSGIPMKQWVKEYRKRSGRIRKIFNQVEEILNWHIRYFTQEPSHWDDETAGSLLSYLFRKCIQTDDAETCMRVADSLIPYYEERQDEAALMKCYMIKMIGYADLDTVNWKKEILECGRQAQIYYERSFDQLDDEERSMGISIYDYETDQYTEIAYKGRQNKEELNSLYLPLFSRSIEMIDRVIPTVDLNEPLHSALPYIRLLFQFRVASLAIRRPADDFTEEQKNFLYQTAKSVYEKEEDETSENIGTNAINEITYLMTQRLLGKVEDETIRRRVTELSSSFPDPECGGERQCDNLLLDADQVILLSMGKLAEDNPAMTEDLRTVLRLAIHRAITISHRTYCEYVLCNEVYRYICPNLKYLENRAKIVESLLGITVFRQMQTAFHTLMVGKCAMLITEYLVDERPELLAGQLETRNAGQVRARKQEFIDFVYLASLLHDVGKLFCSAVINMQYRKITDIEFETIKFHPETGRKILSQIPQLEEFSDIAAGHHKSFDGRTGYPMDFDNTKSPQKIFIDLITICDSLDAATDTLGRNYAAAKTFEEVLSELKERSGTYYSDVLVDFISGSGELKEKLAVLIGKERGQVYYDVYAMLEKMFEDI